MKNVVPLPHNSQIFIKATRYAGVEGRLSMQQRMLFASFAQFADKYTNGYAENHNGELSELCELISEKSMINA